MGHFLMKKVEKRLLSGFLAVTMAVSMVHVSIPVNAKEIVISDSAVNVGIPRMTKEETMSSGVKRAEYVFDDTLTIKGTDIRSVSVQFVSSATKGVEDISYDDKHAKDFNNDGIEDVALSTQTPNNWTHVMVNSVRKNDKGEILPLTAEEWKTILVNYFKIYVESDHIRSIMVSVSEEVDFGIDNLIEYNADNGHYYELVQEQGTWTNAREKSLKADSMGPAYESYLVNITSEEENAFVYTICRTTSWIGTSCDPNVKLEGNWDGKSISYKQTAKEKYGYTLDDNKYNKNHPEVNAYWFYVDGPEAGKLMTYGPAQSDDHNHQKVTANTMKLAKEGQTYNVGSSMVEGAYESDFNNWANDISWKNSKLYEAGVGNDGANEPNNCNYDAYANAKDKAERYMAIYSREDYPTYKWMIPSMWNDFWEGNPAYIRSYIIEYSPKRGEVPDVTNDIKQSIVEINGTKNQTITGENFGVRGKSGHLTVEDIVKEENGNVVVTVNGNKQQLNPTVSDKDLNKLNKAIDDNKTAIVTVTVKDQTTGQEKPIQITIVPVEEIAIKSAELTPYKKAPAHYFAGDKVAVDNVTLNDGTVYSGDDLNNGNFTYQWQYAENDKDSWHNIDGATDAVLSPEMTKKYAGNKIRVVVSVGDSGEVKKIVADPSKKLYVDGDGYSYDEDVDGTYIDNYEIDASDFVVKLSKAKTMKDAEAIAAADAKAQLNNKAGLKEDKTVTDSDVEDKLNKVSAPGDVDVTFKSDWNGYSAKDKDDYSKTGKTVIAHVVDNEKEKTYNGKKYEIGANDITVSTTVAETFVNANSDEKHAKILSDKAGVVVVSDGTTVSSPKITVKYDSEKPLKAEEGEYVVTYVYEYVSGKTVEVKGKVKVEATLFEVTPTNPNPVSPEKPEDGIEGPVKDDKQSTPKDYVFRIHLDNNVPSVKLEPEVVNATITGLTKDNTDITPIPENGVYTVENVPTDKEVTVKYTVKSTSDDSICTYTYIIDREGKPNDNVNVDTDTTDPTPEDDSDDAKVGKPEGPKTETIDSVDEQVKDITITVPNKVTEIEVIPTREDPKAVFVTDFGKSGIKVNDGTKIDTAKSSVTPNDAKITVTDLKVEKDSVVAVKVKAEDGKTTCVYRYIIKREKEEEKEEEKPDDKQDGVEIVTTVDPIPETLEDKPVVDDSKEPEKVGEETVKKIIITVPSSQDKVVVYPTPKEGKLDPKYEGTGLKEIEKPEGVEITNNVGDKAPSFTVDKLSVGEETVVAVKGVSEDGTNSVIYEYTIVREKDDNVNVNTGTTDPTPEDDSDDAKVGEPEGPQTETMDSVEEQVKDITITVPNKVKELEVVPTREDPSATFVVDFGKSGIKVYDGTKIDATKSYVKSNDAKFTVTDLKVDKDSVVAVKVKSADGTKTCVYRYTIKRKKEEEKEEEKPDDKQDGVEIVTTVDPIPETLEDKPVVDDSKEPEKVGEETVKKITITVPSTQDEVVVYPTPKEGKIDPQYDEDGLKEIEKPEGVEITNNIDDKAPSFTVTKLPVGEETVVAVKGVSEDGTNSVIYEYTIVREKDDNVNINTGTTDPTPEDDSDNAKVGEPEGPKDEAIDGVDEQVKDITITVPNKVTELEVVPTREDPNSTFDTTFGNSGIKVADGTSIDPDKSSVDPKDAKFTVKDIKDSEPSVVMVKVKSADGTKTCVYRYSVKRETNEETPELEVTRKPTATAGPSTGNVKPEDITYEKTNPQDKTEPIDSEKKIATSNALKINGSQVPDDKYSVSADGKKLIISRDYLDTLEKGTYPAVLTYSDGKEQAFNVSILEYDEQTVVKNPPLFSMYKEIVVKKNNTFTVNLNGIKDYAKVTSEITGKGKKAKSVVKIKQQKNGDVLITPKKTGKTQVTCTIIQNGAEYKVVVDIKVLKQYKGTSKNYNLKTKGLVKTSGELPEFNVYKRIVKGKNTKIKFTKVATDAKVKFYVANKKEAKSLKIGKVKRKGKTATCTIVGKKKGWVHLTAEITQNGKTYYTRLLVRIDDGSWSKKQLNKYLK